MRETFEIPRVNVIESSNGFTVEVLGRVDLKYSEGPRTMTVDSEILVGNAIEILRNSIQTWEAPFENEEIDEDKRESIVDNIQRAFKFRGTRTWVR